MVTQVIEDHVSKGSATPTGVGLQWLQNYLGPHTYAQTVWPRATKFGTYS